MYIHLTQFLAVFTATSSSISDGMQYGWCSPTVPLLMAEDSPIKITTMDAEWLDSIYMIGGIAGLPFTLYLSDKIGRKRSVSIASVIYIISWLLIIFGTNVDYIYVARFLAGLGGNMSFVCMPMYIGEIAHKNIRGFLGSFIYIMVLIGVIIVYTVAPLLEIYLTAVVGICFPIFQLLTFSFMPESPYYLLLQGKEDEAKQSLTFLRGFNNIDKELEEIKMAVERQQGESGRLQDIFLIDSNRKGLIIMTFLNASQHFGAISVILMNTHTILGGVDDVISTYEAGIIFSVIMLLSTIAGSLLLDHFGRKILLIISSLSTAACLLIIAIYFHLESSELVEGLTWVPALAVILYAVAFRLGLGLIPLVITGEIFPTAVKAVGMTISDISYVVFGVISLNVYHALTNLYGFHAPFYIFGIWCVGATIFTAIYIPETKGKTLEEIQILLKGKNFDKK